MLETTKRTILKTLTMKLIEVLISGIILQIVFNQPYLAFGIPLLCEGIQTFLYFIHERVWSKIEWDTSHEGHICEECPYLKCKCPLHEEINGKK